MEEQIKVGLPTEEEYHREQILLNQGREIYNPNDKTHDLSKVKYTDLRDKPRLYMPKPRPQAEECLLEAKKNMYMNATEEFIRNNCMKDGTQIEGFQEELKQGINEVQEFKKEHLYSRQVRKIHSEFKSKLQIPGGSTHLW